MLQKKKSWDPNWLVSDSDKVTCKFNNKNATLRCEMRLNVMDSIEF